jgi:hypothetical protein
LLCLSVFLSFFHLVCTFKFPSFVLSTSIICYIITFLLNWHMFRQPIFVTNIYDFFFCFPCLAGAHTHDANLYFLKAIRVFQNNFFEILFFYSAWSF